MTNLRKGFSLGGPAPITVFDGSVSGGPVYPADPTTLHANDYRQPSVREQMQSGPAPTTWVKLWIDFNWLLQDFTYQPGMTQYGDVWDWLNHSPYNSYAIQRLDRQIRAANDDGKSVVLTVYQSLPAWCANVAPGTTDPAGRPLSQAYPSAASRGPWSMLMAYLFARYKYGVPANATGPGHSGTNQYGNPYGAWAYMVEFTNEPNHLCWPQTQSGISTYASVVSLMFKTAEECSYFWAGTGPPYPLGPAVLDAAGDGTNTIGWYDYTNTVVGALQGWQPRKYVGWSLHNYGDVKSHHDGAQARSVIQQLYAVGWKGGTDGNIFITEAGLNMAPPNYALGANGDASPTAEADQTAFNHDTYTAMYNTPQAYCWLNHGVNDYANTSFISGVRRAWNVVPHSPRAPRPYSALWRQLGVA
jgi:hypothetical protein